jgi:predicted glycosyltransferase
VTRPIGYYVHHHGDGHRQRALAIARHAGGRVTLLGTGLAGRTGDIAAIDLPDDRLPDAAFGAGDGTIRPNALHYAPIDHDGVRRRVAAIAAWIATDRPALMIVDVSVEVAMLARLASVPTVYVRLGGRRDDPPHHEAFRGAAALLAPFHPLLDDPRVPHAVREATLYAPGLVARPPAAAIDEDVVLGVVGKGGGASDGERWATAARATPDVRWRVIGPCTVPADRPDNLTLLGWIGDAGREIAAAGIVVGAAGDGLVGAVIAAAKRFVCIPEPRPFDEQIAKAARLAALGAAVVVEAWPPAARWPALLRTARALDTRRIAQLDDADGCERVAKRLLALADGRAPGAAESIGAAGR